MKKERVSDKKGISLIVLVITIIVIIILAVAVILSIANNNPIENAKEARFKNDVKTMQEELELLKASNYAKNNGASYNDPTTGDPIELSDLKSSTNYTDDFLVKDGVLYIKSGNKLTEKEQKWADELGVLKGVEVISKTESKVGCYADIDGDGVADGVIYADLAVGGSGQWGYANFSYEKETETKDYYVRGSYKGVFSDDKKDLISVVNGSTGKERFYVMALKDFNTGTPTEYCWYGAGGSSGITSGLDEGTSTKFGSGKKYTQIFIDKWNAAAYGEQNQGTNPDMWGVIQNEVEKGWFVPSNGEWAAFGNNLEITSSNYVSKDLSDSYWLASLINGGLPSNATIINGDVYDNSPNGICFVRLSATF